MEKLFQFIRKQPPLSKIKFLELKSTSSCSQVSCHNYGEKRTMKGYIFNKK